jgi:hypothetical protein
MKPTKKHFTIMLGALAGLLLVFGVTRMIVRGPFLPELIDKNLPDAIIFAAIGILLWNRKLRSNDEKAERAKQEALAAAEAEKAEKAEGSEAAAAPPAGAAGGGSAD